MCPIGKKKKKRRKEKKNVVVLLSFLLFHRPSSFFSSPPFQNSLVEVRREASLHPRLDWHLSYRSRFLLARASSAAARNWLSVHTAQRLPATAGLAAQEKRDFPPQESFGVRVAGTCKMQV